MGRRKEVRLQNGSVLITALVFVLIVTTLVAGVSTFSVGAFSKEATEGDYASALHMADAGINYELRYVSQNQLTAPYAHQSTAHYTGTLSGVPGSFETWVTNEDGSGNWSPPNAMVIHSIGTVNGVSRKVECRGTRQSLFDAFASFGIMAVTEGGANTVIVGDVGSNGTITLNSSIGVASGYDMYLAGPNASGVSGSNVISVPNPVLFPSIDTIIQKPLNVGVKAGGTSTAALAWTYLSSSQTQRANPLMRMFINSGGVLSGPGSQAQTQLAGAAPNAWSGNTNASMQIATADFGGSKVKAGTIYITTDADGTKKLVTSSTTGAVATAVSALILPARTDGLPADYFFTDINLSGSGNVIIIDNAGWTNGGTAGTVRIWMDGKNGNPAAGGEADDTINTEIYFTDPNPATFRLYYSKCASLSIAGNSYIYGGVYAVNPSCSGTPTVKVTGGSKLYGSVLANYIVMSGNSQIIFPANGIIDNPADFSLWFGFKDSWKEVAIPGGTVFADGTAQ